MNVLTIGSDRALFAAGSAARARIAQYGTIVGEYHIIVFSLRSHGFVTTKIADNVWVYPTNSVSRLFYVHDARRVARTIGPVDLVSTQDPFECGLAGMRIARDAKARLQVQLHTDPFSKYFKNESLLNRIRLLIARRVLPRADCIRVVSERIKKGLRDAQIPLTSEPQVLPIFVDTQHLIEEQASFSLRARYPQFDQILLMVSRLTKEKRIDIALEALASLAPAFPKVGLVIVGDGPLRSALAAQAEQLGITACVRFEGWQTDLVPYYTGADAYLLTSDYEGYGRTLIEAAAFALPISTTDVGVAGEIFVDNKSALISQVGRGEQVAQNVGKILRQPELRAAIGREAQKAVAARAITFEQYLARMKETFANCCRAE